MRAFRRLAVSTLAAVYVLILVGGVVRSTGSGMGCPDWPKCFGSWVPPTSVEDLPGNYKEIYSQYRHEKNIKFARYLRAIGLSDTADKLLADKSVLIEADFNPTKTMVEYFNRLVGVTIGFLIFAVFVASLKYRKTQPRVTTLAFATFVMVGFQGWIGSFVVSSNLTPWTITVHMFLALVIVAMLVYIIRWSSDDGTVASYSPVIKWWLIACIVVSLVQILLGTQVREAIDRVAAIAPRNQWIELIGGEFLLHRSFSWIVAILHAGLIINLVKTTGWKAFPIGLILLILGTLISGAGMANFGVPPSLQPLHLLFATLTFGVQFMLLLNLNHKQKAVPTI